MAASTCALALASPVFAERAGEQPVDDGLVQPDLLGGHRALVELVDLVGQLGGDLPARTWCAGRRAPR